MKRGWDGRVATGWARGRLRRGHQTGHSLLSAPSYSRWGLLTGTAVSLIFGFIPLRGQANEPTVRFHLILIALQDTRAEVTEHLAFADTTKATPAEHVRFSLPEGAHALSVEAGLPGLVPIGEDGLTAFRSTGPIGPTVVYRYQLPTTGARFAFGRPLDFPTQTLNLILTPAGGNVTSRLLPFQETGELEGVAFYRFAGQDLAPGEWVDLTMRGLPMDRTPLFILAGLLALSLTALLALALFRHPA